MELHARRRPPGVSRRLWQRAADRRLGAAFHARTRASFGRSFEWGIIGEDLPDPDNRVRLADDLTDSDGLPAPRIAYRVSDNTRRMLDFHVARAREAMQAAGAVEIRRNPPDPRLAAGT